MYKVSSWIFLLTGIAVGLGAFGHDSNAAKVAAEVAKFPTFDPRIAKVLFAVWHFCSGCMLVFGATIVWTWWRWRRGERRHFLPAELIAVLYLVVGPASVAYTGIPFFWLFFALGLLLLASSLPMRRAHERSPA